MSARKTLEFVLLKYFSGTEDVTPETAGELEKLQANILIDAFAHELSESQKKFFGDISSQGNDGNWYSVSDWLMKK